MSARVRERLTIRITKKHMQCLDRLVEAGVYNSRNAAIRGLSPYALRALEMVDNEETTEKPTRVFLMNNAGGA